MTDENKDIEMEVDQAAITVKLTPFWANNPQTWFDSAELQFKLTGITADKKKFLHVLTALSPEVSDKISDFIKKPPELDMYDEEIKRLLISRLSPSDERKLETLLSGLDLGDRRPSDLLRRIRTLAGSNFNDLIIKTLWIRRLPEVLRLTLAALPDTTNLDEISKISDKIYDAMSESQTIASATTPSFKQPTTKNSNTNQSNNNKKPPTLKAIMDRLNMMEARLNNLTSQVGRSRSRSRNNNNNYQNNSGNRSTFRNQSNSGNQNNSGNLSNTNNRSNLNYRLANYNQSWCYNHNRFSYRARNCVPPCSFHNSNQAISEQTQQQQPSHSKNE